MSRSGNIFAVGAVVLGAIALQVPLIARASDPGVTDKEVVLGTHGMLTGTYSMFGVYTRFLKAWFDRINEEGGIHGRKVKLLVEDNASKPQVALQAAKKLVERDNVFAMVGSVGFVHMAVYPYLREKQVPDLWVANGFMAYSTPTHPLTFQFSPTQMNETKFFAEYIANNFSGKKIGFGHSDSAEAKALSQEFVKGLGTKAKLVSEQTNPIGAQNLNAEMLAFQRSGADVVYMHWNPPLSVPAIKFAAEQGYHPQYILGSQNANGKFLSLVGPELAEGAISWHYVYAEDNVEIPGVRKHLEFMKAHLPHETPGELTMASQYLAETIEATLRSAGRDLTRASVLKAAESLKDFKCSVCREPNSTGPDKHLLTTAITPLVVRKGKWVQAK